MSVYASAYSIGYAAWYNIYGAGSTVKLRVNSPPAPPVIAYSFFSYSSSGALKRVCADASSPGYSSTGANSSGLVVAALRTTCWKSAPVVTLSVLGTSVSCGSRLTVEQQLFRCLFSFACSIVFRTLLSSVPDVFWTTDGKLRCMHASRLPNSFRSRLYVRLHLRSVRVSVLSRTDYSLPT